MRNGDQTRRAHTVRGRGRHGRDHAAQPADRGHARCCSTGRTWFRTPTGVCGRHRQDVHVHRKPARHVPLRGRATARRPAPGGDGSLRRPGRAARRPPGRPTTAPARPSTPRRCWSSARSTPHSTTAPVGRQASTCASTHPRYFLINGKALPGHRPRSRHRPGSGSCCATSTRETSTTRWACWVPTRQSSRSTAACWHPSRVATSPRRSAPGQTADALVTAPAATADQHRLAVYDGSLLLHNSNMAGIRRDAHLPDGHRHRWAIDTTGSGRPATLPSPRGTLTATVDDTAHGRADIQAAEYFLDSVAGTGTAHERPHSAPSP